MGARSFAGVTGGCCVGRAWRQPMAAGGRVEVGSRSCFLGMLQQKNIFKDAFGHHYVLLLLSSTI